jgi:hypothetical protein
MAKIAQTTQVVANVNKPVAKAVKWTCPVHGEFKAINPQCEQCEKVVKLTFRHRYLEAKDKVGYDHKQFCGLILRERVEKVKADIDAIARMWSSEVPVEKSDIAFDFMESEIKSHLNNVMLALRNGSTKVTAALEPAPF